MKYEKYLVKKGALDLLSSLKALDKKIIDEKLKKLGLKTLEELKDYILEDFEYSLNMTKDNIITCMYFKTLLTDENTKMMSVYQEDIEDFFAFVYKNGDHYSYYIPIEIKEIINKILKDVFFFENIYLENAKNTPINKDLKSMLETLSVSDLKDMGDILLLNKFRSRRKKEIVNTVYEALTDKDKLTDVIKRFTDDEFNFLKSLMSNKGTIQDNKISTDQYYFLYTVGMVFLFRKENTLYISMTDDVYKTIKKIDLDALITIVNENTKVYNMVRAMVELYGILPFNELDYYYSLYYGNGKKLVAPTDVLLFCARVDNINIIYTEDNVYFAHMILNDSDTDTDTDTDTDSLLDEIVSRQKEIKRKPVELKELLKYCDYNYYEETKEKDRFKKYLKKKNMPDDIIKFIIKIISDSYRLGYSFINTSIEFLQECEVEINKNNAQEILNYLTDIYNNSRLWENNGWTPTEMSKNYEQTKV